MRTQLLSFVVCLAALACGSPSLSDTDDEAALATENAEMEDAALVASERSGLGVDPLEASATIIAAPSPIDPRKSLMVTEVAALKNFTFLRVMTQLAGQGGSATALSLYRQWWDTQNTKATAMTTGGAHCDDMKSDAGAPTINGFPHVCPRGEGAQASEDPFVTKTGAYQPIGVVARFDLAPTTGATCGEYRIVFARQSGGRNFIIFEAALANPRLDLGLEGCRPVAAFIADLSNKTLAVRTAELERFFFTGLPGFGPVVHIDNYGNATTRVTGQVRTNQFMDFQGWNLREFKLRNVCSGTTCALRMVPAADRTNPFGDLFSPSSKNALAPAFRTHLINSVPALAVNDINRFSYSVPSQYNQGESDAQNGGTNYRAFFGTAPSQFRTDLQAKLTAIGSTLTPDNIVARAQALSCGGCHNTSSGADLGGGLTFPQSARFVHMSEFTEAGPEGARFAISSALTGTFLPHRTSVLSAFLARPVVQSAFVSQTTPVTAAPGAPVRFTVTLRNTGSTAWTAANGFELVPTGATLGVKSVPLAATDKVHFGQAKVFSVTGTAPTVPGSYAVTYQLRSAAGPFGAMSATVKLVVQFIR